MEKNSKIWLCLRKINKKFVKNTGERCETHNKIAQKLLSITVSTALMTTMVPLGRQNFTAEAATTNGVISKKLYATPDDLMDSNTFSLATKDDTKVGKINFGTRHSDVKYYYDGWSAGNVRTDETGALPWLIAGSDGDDRLILYSEEPMMSAKALDAATDSRFQTHTSVLCYDGGQRVSYADRGPREVYSSHWGASNLRQQLAGLCDTYFATNETKLVTESTITTRDTKNST